MVRRCLGYFKEGVHTKCSKRSKWQTSLWLRFNAAWTRELHGNDCCRRGMEVAWISRACAAQSKLINNMRLGHDKHQQASASISKHQQAICIQDIQVGFTFLSPPVLLWRWRHGTSSTVDSPWISSQWDHSSSDPSDRRGGAARVSSKFRMGDCGRWWKVVRRIEVVGWTTTSGP